MLFGAPGGHRRGEKRGEKRRYAAGAGMLQATPVPFSPQ
jgi:hypothetical protein